MERATDTTPTRHEALRRLAESATFCPTCGGTPNAENFGGMCTPCDTRHAERLVRTANILRSRGLTTSHEDRTLIAAGDRAAVRLAR